MSLNLVLKWLAFGLLLAGLALPAVAPEIANIAVLVLAGAALLLSFGNPSWRAVFRQPAVVMPLAAGMLLALAFSVTATSPLDVAAVFYFAPLFAVAPMALVLMQLPARLGWLASSAALVGVAGAAAVASCDAFVLGAARAGVSVANPIHFADVSLMLGFVAVTGTLFAPAKWRLLYLAGPLLAGYAVYLSGSRGPLLAFFVLAAAALGYWIVFNASWRRGGIRALVAVLALCAVLAIAWQLGWLDRLGRLGELGSVLQAADTTASAPGVDVSTQQRLIMYRTAYAAFLDSPIFGHGLVDFIAKTARYAPAGVEFPRYDHLHNDIADFGVVGGVLGLVAYGLLLLAPLVQAGRTRNSPGGAGTVLLALSASTGYFAMGLTNAMFGLLTMTVLYAFILAIVTRPALGAAEGASG